MFSLSYMWNELRRRFGRTLVTALGLAAGVGLVMGIIGVSEGLSDAQNSVLSPLSSVGTDVIVTRTVAPTTSTATTTTTTPTNRFGGAGGRGGGGGFFARGAGGISAQNLNASDKKEQQLLSANTSVLTDLAKLGKPGTHYTHDFFVPGTLVTFPAQAVKLVDKVPDVTGAVGALSLQALHESGTVPKITATYKTGGQTITKNVKAPQPTAVQQSQERSCIEKLLKKTFSSNGSGGLTFRGGAGAAGGGGGGGTRPVGGAGFGAFTANPAFSSCLTPAQREYEAKYVVPTQTIRQVLSPPTTNIQNSSYTVAGVDPSDPTSGIITKSQLVKGSWFGTSSANEVLVASAYAESKKLTVDSKLTINGTAYTVIGIVNPTLTGDTADVYFTLSKLQSLSSAKGNVNEVLVSVNKASNVAGVVQKIKKELPGATVLTSKSLADQVSGSLSSAHKLANTLGVALAIVAMIAAFLIAMLLTMSSVSKRVREIGTLRAIGWSRRRVVRQIVTETLGIGVAGAAVGVAVGVAVCAIIGAIGPGISVTSSGLAVGASTLAQASTLHPAASLTKLVHLDAPIRATTILLGIVVALVGGLLAGLTGGWRASRLVPAEALRDIG